MPLIDAKNGLHFVLAFSTCYFLQLLFRKLPLEFFRLRLRSV